MNNKKVLLAVLLLVVSAFMVPVVISESKGIKDLSKTDEDSPANYSYEMDWPISTTIANETNVPEIEPGGIHAGQSAWNTETVDSSGIVGSHTSIALDSNGYPHISYYDWTNEDLKYAKWTESTWSKKTVDSAGDVGGHTSIALDSNGYPHISYCDYTNGDLKYAKWTGSTWSKKTVDSAGDVGYYTSIALDSDGYPCISYYDSFNDDLKYAKWTGSAWGKKIVDSSGGVGEYTSIALDSNGNPHISYRDYTNGDLKYAKWTGSTWSKKTVDSSGIVGRYTSIALDSNGYPRISYYDNTNADLKYAKWTGSAWSIATVDSSGDVGRHTSIALDSNGNPHISYYDDTNDDLKYAKWTGSAWSIATVDSSGDVGRHTSIAFDSNGNPHISYYDSTPSYDLKYAKGTAGCPDADGDEVCDADDNCPNVPGPAWNCGCPCATGGDADVVFIMDTSSSMDDDFSTLCSKISTIISDLQSQGITVTYKIVGITENRDCTSDYVTNMVTNPLSDQCEDWGPATQDIAEKYSWRVGATKIIIPMSDECPENGGYPCNDPGDDRDAITNACAACQEHNVMASPVMCSGQSQCGDTLGQALATCSHGTVFRSTDPASDLVNGIKAIIGSGTCDRDGDSVPDGCDPWPDDPCRCGDQDGDGVDDCACVLYLMEGDVSMDGHVAMVDVMFIAQYKAGLRNLNTSQLQCADTTDDGDVKMVDAMHIAQWKADPDGTLGVLYKPLWESQADADMRKPEE